MVNEVPDDALEEEPAEQEAPEPEKPAVREEEPEKEFTVEGLVADAKSLGARAKKAGLKPFRRMFRVYADTVLDAADKLFEGLEGDKRKKGD